MADRRSAIQESMRVLSFVRAKATESIRLGADDPERLQKATVAFNTADVRFLDLHEQLEDLGGDADGQALSLEQYATLTGMKKAAQAVLDAGTDQAKLATAIEQFNLTYAALVAEIKVPETT